MMKLTEETDARWARAAVAHLDELLLEHAHLERKAAQSAVQFLSRYPEHAFLQRPLSELAREELGHFEAVLFVLERRGRPFGWQQASPYAGRLQQCVRPGEPQRLLDRLLCAAVIEARSCERMKLLGAAVESVDPELGRFYRGLCQAEARHYKVYVELAEHLAPAAEVEARLGEICDHEAHVLASAPSRPRMHNAAGGRDDRDRELG